MSNFAIIGAAGFVAPRHMEAIYEIGGNLIAAYDPHDSVGILDRYFPETAFFTEFELFDRFLSRNRVNYVSICSPNYLHDAHCRAALRWGADAICEKPLVIKPHNLDELQRQEAKYGNRIWTILQLRLHPALVGYDEESLDELDIDYCTPRGSWYDYSWKGDFAKSGGLIYNIGVHLFDLAQYLLGPMVEIIDANQLGSRAFGTLRMQRGIVNYELNTDSGNMVRRTFGDLDLTHGFERLHTLSYSRIIRDDGFGIEDAREAIKICHAITMRSRREA